MTTRGAGDVDKLERPPPSRRVRASLLRSATQAKALWDRLPHVFHLLRMNVVVALVNFGVSVVLARVLGAQARGQMALLILWSGTIAHLCLAGTHLYLSRAAASEAVRPQSVYSQMHRFLWLVLPPTLILFGGVAFLVDRYTQAQISPWDWLIAAASIPFSALNSAQIQIELGRGRYSNWIALQTSFTFSQALLIAALAVFREDALSAYMLAYLGASIFSCGIGTYLIAKSGIGGTQDVLRQAPLDLAASARKDGLSSSLVVAASTVDRFVVGTAFSTEALGLYVVATSISRLQNLVVEALAPLFFVSAARTGAAGGEPLARRLRQTIAINLIVAVSLLAAAPTIFVLAYGRAYASGMPLVLLLICVFSLRGMARAYEEVLRGANHSLQQSYALLAMTGTFAVLAAVAIVFHSMAGVVCALILGSLVGFLWTAAAVSRQSGLSLVQITVPSARDVNDLLREGLGYLRRTAHGI